MSNFLHDLDRGTKGECFVWNYLIHLPNTRTVVDVRDDKRFREFDVDFLWENSKRNFVWLEVKSDDKAHETGNFAYEVFSNYENRTQGCMERTKAEYVYLFLTQTDELYILSVSAIRQYVAHYTGNMVDMGDCAKGFLLPLSDLTEKGIAKKLI